MASFWRMVVRAQPVLAILAFGLMIVALVVQWDALAARDARLSPVWLAVAAALIAGGWCVEIEMWRRILAMCGGSLPYTVAVSFWFRSAVVRYVPGNIWQFLSMTSLCRERGIPATATLASTALFQGVHILAVVLLAAAYLAFRPTHGGSPDLGLASGWIAAGVAVPVGWFFLHPGPFLGLASRVLERIGRPPLPLRLTRRHTIAMLAMTVPVWMLLSAGFSALVVATQPGDWTTHTVPSGVVIAYPIAYAVGYMSLLTPGGLGVREGALFALIAPWIGAPRALVATIGMRLLEVALEFLAAVAVVGIPHLVRMREGSSRG